MVCSFPPAASVSFCPGSSGAEEVSSPFGLLSSISIDVSPFLPSVTGSCDWDPFSDPCSDLCCLSPLSVSILSSSSEDPAVSVSVIKMLESVGSAPKTEIFVDRMTVQSSKDNIVFFNLSIFIFYSLLRFGSYAYNFKEDEHSNDRCDRYQGFTVL